MPYTYPDNYDAYDAYEREQTQKKAKLPFCDWCLETIYEESCYKISDDIVCPDCIENCRKWTGDYIEEG